MLQTTRGEQQQPPIDARRPLAASERREGLPQTQHPQPSTDPRSILSAPTAMHPAEFSGRDNTRCRSRIRCSVARCDPEPLPLSCLVCAARYCRTSVHGLDMASQRERTALVIFDLICARPTMRTDHNRCTGQHAAISRVPCAHVQVETTARGNDIALMIKQHACAQLAPDRYTD